jgi:excinuclease UvrABC ATPase subunit
VVFRDVKGRIFRFAAFILIASSLWTGCAWKKHRHRETNTAPAGPVRVGTIAAVNEDLRFVLVDVGSLYTPAAGTALKTFSNDTETGIIAVTSERKRPFIVADIVKGDPKVGDEVEE